jgi:membrane-associated protease RseP (regulator of RpoE activity)
VLAVRFAALNLLPISPLNGGMIVTTFVGWKKGLPDSALTAVTYMGLCMSLILIGYWILQFALMFR